MDGHPVHLPANDHWYGIGMDRILVVQLNLFFFAALVVVVLLTATPATADFVGPAQFKDGDSIYVQGRELRLFGIDVPEWSQVCHKVGKPWMAGQEAKRVIASMVADRPLICEDTGARTYGRPVVRCYIDGQDLSQRIAASGWAFDDKRFSKGAYLAAQQEARAARIGIWAGTCQPPWEWRRENK